MKSPKLPYFTSTQFLEKLLIDGIHTFSNVIHHFLLCLGWQGFQKLNSLVCVNDLELWLIFHTLNQLVMQRYRKVSIYVTLCSRFPYKLYAFNI